MKCFIELTLLPNPEIPLYFLWEKAHQQLHLALVAIQDEKGQSPVGVSFPEYDAEKHQLGSKLRLFAETETQLEQLNLQQGFSRLSDYVHLTGIRPIPDKVHGHALFKRVQPKSSNARLARRLAKRKGISAEQALLTLNKRSESFSNAPYVRIKSLSSGKQYRLMIARLETEPTPQASGFSTYGLSSQRSVPLF